MENIEIARALSDVADLLEIQGANPFRVRAYRNAAQMVETHPAPLRKLVKEGADLTELPAIGKDMARYITELVTVGELSQVKEIAKEIPVSLIELTRLPGVGPKKAKRLFEELEITNLDELEAAARAEQVQALSGFGKKTQDRILRSIEQRRQRESRVKLADAEQYIEPLLEYLRACDDVQRLEVAGSYRRRKETVGDIDLLAIADASGAVMDRFVSYADVGKVESAGDTKSTVFLKSGLQVDLRIVPEKSYGAAMQYFTGSKEHNVKLRMRAIDRELRLSEYGVFRVANGDDKNPWAGEQVAGRSEEDVYQALDLPWIPPELRENRGEIEAAQNGSLPTLVTLDDIRGDLQMHSTWSDGRESIETMLRACARRGYEYIAITDHSKALAMTGGLDAGKLREQWAEIEEVAARHDEIRLLRGLEVDILADGALDMEDDMLAELDLVLASIHSRMDLPATEQTERILRALQHPEVNILGHPTARQINRRDPMKFDLDAVLECAAEHNVAVEINAQPDRLDLSDTAVLRARQYGAMIVISTDAHYVVELDFMRYGVEQARRAWLEKSVVINTFQYGDLVRFLEKRK